MGNLLNIIKSNAAETLEITTGFWHHLHSNPELSFKEQQTSNFVAKVLKDNNIEVFEGLNGNGLIGIIKGAKSGKTIGIRAELDALPITENTNLGYTSKNKGSMHACGHDIHMASLLGAAILISRIKDELSGKILLIFESGEELLPGGATQIIDSEIFKLNRPDAIFAFHVLPELAAGKAGFCEGQYMASGDEIHITVKGKGGHAALPHTTVNPILIASKLLLDLKDFIDTKSPSHIPSILSFGKVTANGATNIIPDDVQIEGTFRTMDEEWRRNAHKLIEKISNDTCQSLGGDCIVDIRKGYPSIFNNPEICNRAKKLTQEYLGHSNVIDLDRRMTTDDFAYFSQIIPSVFFRLGVGFENGGNHQLHSSTFIVNQDILKYSSGLLTWISYNMSKP
ncbi:MAG: amidohydrolase [Bacteroidales bacterium]|nr:MAG: amidohydrolase [Bacteroidales bacterium]